MRTRRELVSMAETQHVDVLVFGSGEAGKYVAWTMAKAGFTTAAASRRPTQPVGSSAMMRSRVRRPIRLMAGLLST
jgi:choline dehydrogenase-like flavoprotein